RTFSRAKYPPSPNSTSYTSLCCPAGDRKMPCFDDLPNELLAIILDYVTVPDFENFAQINRHVKRVAQQQLERHRMLSRQYASIKLPACNLKSMCDLLKTFMTTTHGQYGRAVVYNRSLDFHGHARELRPEDVDWLIHQVSIRKIFTLALAQSDGADLREK
ncbi:MAG: hypothetical protein Q9198_009296, partial [Flavoplaca austrocitrina]